MGGSAGQFVNTVTTAARETVEKAPDKIKNYAAELVNDPARVAAAVSTVGISEQIRETGVAIDQRMREDAMRNAPAIKALPEMPAPPSPEPTPPGQGGDKKPPEGSIKETVDEQRRARGRASTILTGRRGLTGGATTARRTLLGV